jgi:hypothetical protein
MLLEQVNQYRKVVINGLEGCGKSSQLFNELKDVATTQSPVIFAFKNYALMTEQIESWTSRFNVPKEDFAIVGFNNDYQPAKEAYTNPNCPWMIPEKARFIFISQGLLQRNKIRDLTWEAKMKTGKKPIIKYVIIDEFDFSIGIVPTLDYFLNHCPSTDLKEKISKDCCDYIFKNYTREDVWLFQKSQEETNGLFNLAFWIQDIECNLVVLTSEILATILLELVGFNVIDFGKKHFHNECLVNISKDENIGRNFFSKMNTNLAWNKVGFNTIISDCIASGIKDSNSLEIDVITHTGARGSNSFIGKDILTVISYIPKSKIEEVKDCINCFIKEKNKDDSKIPFFKYNEIEALFYRDRFCQAIGRVVGYRGSKETHVLMHSDLYSHFDSMQVIDLALEKVQSNEIGLNCFNELKDISSLKFNDYILKRLMNGVMLMPYDIKDWYFEFEGKETIWELVKTANDKGVEKKKNFTQHKKAMTSNNLDLSFEKSEGDSLSYEEIWAVIKEKNLRSIGGSGLLQPTKVAKHFGCVIKQAKINKKMTRVLIGIKIKEK